jgi:hypothetical protein
MPTQLAALPRPPRPMGLRLDRAVETTHTNDDLLAETDWLAPHGKASLTEVLRGKSGDGSRVVRSTFGYRKPFIPS